jgi:uncharacterized protein
MKKYFNWFITFAMLFFAGTSFAYTPPPAPAQGWYVVDQTGKLSEAQKTALNQKIDQVSKTTKNEFGILLLNTMEGNSIEDVAYATFNTWGIGKKGLDNGVLIVVSLQERKTRIETGKGVGGEVTDLQSKDILDNTLRPYLKKGDFAGGFTATLDALSALIESRNKPATAPSSNNAVNTAPVSYPNAGAGCALAAAGVGATDGGSNGGLVVLLLLAAGGLVLWRVRVSRRRATERLAEAERVAEEIAEENRENQRLANAARLERERLAKASTPAIPVVTAPVPVSYRPVVTSPRRPTPVPPAPSVVKAATVGVTAGVLAAEAERRVLREVEEKRKANELAAKRKRDADDAAAQNQRDADARRQRDEDDARRRRDSDSSSSSSSYSSSSSSSDYSSGGGYDGGSSGGGGASSDF